ncbi:MAG TPA: 16S rRNA (guanine(966)-N(2))-methyltransferase RsmD [Chloroflexia bacterium]
MRVISGTAKGRTLKGPATRGTRPMTDRLKTSLFDTLVPYGVGGARVLDLYAGSGSLGIEMLSRGAEWADFVEHNAGVVRIIEDNLASTGLSNRARVYKMAVGAFLAMRAKAHEQPAAVVDTAVDYDIILLDPPYADAVINDTLETIASGPLLAEDGILVIGHATQVHLAEEYGDGRLKRARHRVMGGSAFSIYERMAD